MAKKVHKLVSAPNWLIGTFWVPLCGEEMSNPFPKRISVTTIGDGPFEVWSLRCDTKEKAEYARDAINGREALEAERNLADAGWKAAHQIAHTAAIEAGIDVDGLTHSGICAHMQRRIKALEERNAKLVALLRIIERAARRNDECPLCRYLTYRGPGEYHAKDCELAALLAEEKD